MLDKQYNIPEAWLGIDSINKDDYLKSVNNRKFWVYFANIYENYFQHLNTKNEILETTKKLLENTENHKIKQAILYFSNLRMEEL